MGSGFADDPNFDLGRIRGMSYSADTLRKNAPILERHVPQVQKNVTPLPGRSQEDTQLMTRVRDQRDHAAFATIARHYAPRLKGWLVGRGENGMTAEDIVQEALDVVWRKAHLFDAKKASLSTWLFGVTRNKWIDHKRKTNRMIPVAPDVMVSLVDEPVESPHEILEEQSAARAVREELSNLEPNQQRIIQLAFFEGLTHSQIADQTGIALGTVKSRIRNTLGRMRTRLQEKHGNDL